MIYLVYILIYINNFIRLTVPNFILVFGDVMDELNGEDILDAVSSLSGVFAGTGAVAFVSGLLMVRGRRDAIIATMEGQGWGGGGGVPLTYMF